MQLNPNTDYKELITELIKKQIVILGPFITLAKVRNVKGLTVDDEGNVMSMSDRPQEVIRGLIDQFVQLSGLIVKKTMEPLLAGYPDGITTVLPSQQESSVSPSPQINPAINEQPQQPQPTDQPPQSSSQPTQSTEPNQQIEPKT